MRPATPRISPGDASRSNSPVIISTGMERREKSKRSGGLVKQGQRIPIGRGRDRCHRAEKLGADGFRGIGTGQYIDDVGSEIGRRLARIERHLPALAGKPRALPRPPRTCRCSRPRGPARPADPDGASRRMSRSTSRRTGRRGRACRRRRPHGYGECRRSNPRLSTAPSRERFRHSRAGQARPSASASRRCGPAAAS
jgi:hypothetical protein